MLLHELKVIERALKLGLLPDESPAIDYVIREIKLKELELALNKELTNKYRTKTDVDMQGLNDEIIGEKGYKR